jgi:hypothetical protein
MTASKIKMPTIQGHLVFFPAVVSNFPDIETLLYKKGGEIPPPMGLVTAAW